MLGVLERGKVKKILLPGTVAFVLFNNLVARGTLFCFDFCTALDSHLYIFPHLISIPNAVVDALILSLPLVCHRNACALLTCT